ncbi:hypothetical protein JXA84_02495 [candidate division WOR-3 bacterium]|nr:hypothetical protein [candidate division WOR-3 bacterium]
MIKKTSRTQGFKLSVLFYPFFPFLGLFFGVSVTSIAVFNTFSWAVVVSAFVALGFLLHFYFFKCLRANIFYLENSSVTAAYILYALVISLLFKTIFIHNLILSFVAGVFIRRRKEFFGESFSPVWDGLKTCSLTLPVSFVSYAVYRSSLSGRFTMFPDYTPEGIFLSSGDYLWTAVVLSALFSLTAALTLSGLFFFTGREPVDPEKI